MSIMLAMRLPYLRRTDGRAAEGAVLGSRAQALKTNDFGAAHAPGMRQASGSDADPAAIIEAWRGCRGRAARRSWRWCGQRGEVRC